MQIKAYHFKAAFNLSPLFRGGVFDCMVKEFVSEQYDADVIDMYVELLTLWFGKGKNLYRHFISAGGLVRTQPYYELDLSIWYNNSAPVKLPFNLCLIDCMVAEVNGYFDTKLLDQLKISMRDVYRLEDIRRDYFDLYVDEMFHDALI